MEKAENKQIAMIGLGTMGSALAEALARNHFQVYVLEPLSRENVLPPAGTKLADDFGSVVSNLKPPRKVMLMVTAGCAVDEVISQLTPHLEKGDIIIDGGNSHYADTGRREAALKEINIGYHGVGISGGEEGARSGASVMAGGTEEGFAAIREVLEAIAAEQNGQVYCEYFGAGGAGHFVKMVHNGIEYGMMQAIGEAYYLLHEGLGLSYVDCGSIFRGWQGGVLRSFLIGITADILHKIDGSTGSHLIELIDDAAEQTGTGRWMVTEAMALGVPVPTISEAVAARSLSGGRETRWALDKLKPKTSASLDITVEDIRDSLLATFWCCFAQGFAVLSAGANKHGWPHREAGIARVWQRGCIIRSKILHNITKSYIANPELIHLFSCSEITNIFVGALDGCRRTVSSAIGAGLSVPTMASAVTYADAFRTNRLWTALTQAQRDYFGSHNYRRIDRDGSFHTNWLNDEV